MICCFHVSSLDIIFEKIMFIEARMAHFLVKISVFLLPGSLK